MALPALRAPARPLAPASAPSAHKPQDRPLRAARIALSWPSRAPHSLARWPSGWRAFVRSFPVAVPLSPRLGEFRLFA